MKINVAQQLKSSVGDIRHYAVAETSEEGFPINGEAKLVLTNRSILATGRFKTIINTTCCRCLEEYEYPIEFKMEEEFFPTAIAIGGQLTTIDEIKQADGFIIGEDNVLDMSEALRQNMLLCFPTKPICRVECAGLCQNCGRNLNHGQCDCPDEQIDPRMAPLKSMLLGSDG